MSMSNELPRGRGRRILFYCDSDTLGGHEVQTIELANAAASLGYDVDLLSYRQDLGERCDPAVRQHRLTVRDDRPFPFLRNLRPFTVRRLAKQIAELRPDAVVVAQGNIEIGLKGIFAARTARVRTISYIPFGFRMSEMGARLGGLRDVFSRIWFRLPDAYISVAEYHECLLRRVTSRPIHLIHYPVTPRVGATPASIRPPKGRLRIAVVGRIYLIHKNQNALIPVSEALVAQGLDHEFLIVGDGPDREALQSLVARSSVADRFRFCGWIKQEDLPEFFAREADLWLIPSKFEGIPLVLLEAASSNIPFMISRLGFVEEYGIPESYVIDPNDPVSTASKIRSLISTFSASEFEEARGAILSRHSSQAFLRDAAEALNAIA
jgi:glycosyltransferase involved in cell wall biosynthesis